MAKRYGLAFSLFCVLVALPRFIEAVPTYLPEVPATPPYPPTPQYETPITDGTPIRLDTPSTPESPAVHWDPPFNVPETPFTVDHPVFPSTTVTPSEDDSPQTPQYPTGECKDPKPYDSPCVPCWCDGGEWVCAWMDCPPPQCQDGYTEPGQCCPTCPNGSNCDADGEIIPSGTKAVTKSGAECYCQLGMLYCIPPEPTPPSQSCEEKPEWAENPCIYCWCYDGEWGCVPEECGILSCVDPVISDDQCCPTCPNGPNCEIEGQIVPLGETIQVPDGECTCQNENDFWGPPQVACRPKPPSCTDSTMDITCGYCFCDEYSGGWVCLDRPCYPPLCVDIVKSEDGCCDECPNGYNCEAFGEIIPWGEVKTLFNGIVCACEFSWDWSSSSPLKAQCNYVPEPPAPTTGFISDNSPDCPPDRTPEKIPGNASESPPEKIPGNAPESPPVEIPETAPETPPVEIPETAPEGPPVEIPETAPEGPPEEIPETAPEGPPVSEQ